MLKVFVAETATATPVSAPSSVRAETWRLPSKTKSQWISSAIRGTRCFLHRSSTACSVSRSQTRPQGLCGEHRSMSLHSARRASRSARSISYRPDAVCTRGFSTISRLARRMTPENGP